MQIVGRIFKEILIAIILLGLLFLVGFLLFRNQIAFISSDVPNAVKYEGVNRSSYDINDEENIENQKDPTKVYQNTTGNLKNLEELRKVHTGTGNPFSGAFDEDVETDIPTEKVDIANKANPNDYELPAETTNNATTTESTGSKSLEK